MAGLIPQDFIDDLVARADIVEVIGRRVQLKKAGREFKACCPFHDEKTPASITALVAAPTARRSASSWNSTT
jgi:DNA primase